MTTEPPIPPAPDRERCDDLLADLAVQGLSDAEQAELRRLRAAVGEGDARVSEEALARAAATADLAMGGWPPPEAMPAPMRERLLRAGEAWAAGVRGEPVAVPRTDSPSERRDSLVERKPVAPGVQRPRSVIGFVGAWGGWLAAAASLMIAAIVTTRSPTISPADPFNGLKDYAFAPVAGFDRLDERAAADDRVLALAGTHSEGGIAADLRLDRDTHEGYVAIAGLDVSAESDQQYQVWLLDAGRSHPVDGGTFDITDVQRGATIVVPVRARLPLRTPAGFAVSVEPRGGSVVAPADHILVAAAIPQPGPPAPEDLGMPTAP